MRPQGGQRAGDPDRPDLTSSSQGLRETPSRVWVHSFPVRGSTNVHQGGALDTFTADKWVRTRFCSNSNLVLHACLWPPHFLQGEGAVIRHSGPGRGTIAQSGSWLLTPSHGLLIRLTFRDAEEARHTTVWSFATLTDDREIKGKRGSHV